MRSSFCRVYNQFKRAGDNKRTRVRSKRSFSRGLVRYLRIFGQNCHPDWNLHIIIQRFCVKKITKSVNEHDLQILPTRASHEDRLNQLEEREFTCHNSASLHMWMIGIELYSLLFIIFVQRQTRYELLNPHDAICAERSRQFKNPRRSNIK